MLNIADYPLLKELSDELQKENLAFMVGAGISVGPPSYLPAWGALIQEVLLAIAGEDGKEDIDRVLVHQGQLLNEALLQLVRQELGQDKTDELIRRSMSSHAYSAVHRFLWWAIRNFKAVVVTPNYDELIEEAAKNDASSAQVLRECLIKPHGSLNDLSQACYTADSVYRPLSPQLQRSLLEGLSNKTLVVAFLN